MTTPLSGAIKALLQEYRRMIDELLVVINPIPKPVLVMELPTSTTDEDCKSIQAILTHVVRSGYVYTAYFEELAGNPVVLPKRKREPNSAAYSKALNDMYVHCEQFFKRNPQLPLAVYDGGKTVKVSWGQVFDGEQLFEHAIVHVMRHRLQIENALKHNSFKSV